MGKVVAERFHVLKHARSGGMGEVFLCDDVETGRRVAVKVLSTSSPRIVERFLREAQILAELDHPSIVPHLAHGVHENVPFLAMPWLDGETLAERLSRATLTVAETMALAERIAEALGLVHGRGIVHRDVKPSNIVLVGGIEHPVLLDFGIAHILEDSSELTRTGDLLGTPGYMAPEQASGGHVDARVDIFALGCVLYRCLVGHTPFAGSDPLAVAIKMLLEDAPRLSATLPAAPRAFDDLLARMLARTRDERPEDGAVVRAELARMLDPGTLTEVTPTTVAETLGHDERRVMSLVLARPRVWEPTRAAIEAVSDVLSEPVAANGAVLDVLADGSIVITATGGAPHDVAMRAARCALALREELPDAFIVLTTGHGVMEADAPVGELVDHAVAMLETRAATSSGPGGVGVDDEPAPIRIDRMSAGLLAGRFEVGLDSQALSLGGERPGDRARTLLGRPTPFVGRTRELATLDAMLRECAEEHVPRAVLITANPGVGKSRLREEYVRRLDPQIRVWTAHADGVARGSALGVVAQLLRSAFDVRATDSLAEKRQKIVVGVEGLPSVAEPRRIAEFIGELANVPFVESDSVELHAARRNPQLLATRLRHAFEVVVKAECTRGPLVIVLEDLQWCDPASVKLVDAVLASASALPLLVLAFARPEVAKELPGVFGARGVQEIRLLELSRRASEELVSKVLGAGASAETSALVVARAQGNAFFLEELIRAVAEGRTALPETVVAMVEARLDVLDPTSRKVLRAAAVYGMEATFGGVHALTGGDAHALAELLAKLAQSEYLARATPLGDTRGDTAYVFRHALVRQAAYAMLTDEDRRLGHRLAAEWLVARAEPDAVVVAEHFDQAGDRDRAAAFFQTAAEQALARSQLDATIALSNRAVELGATGQALARCRMLRGEAKVWKGEPSSLAITIETLSLIPTGSAAWFRAITAVLYSVARVGDAQQLARTVGLLLAAEPLVDDGETASYQAWAYGMSTWMLALTGTYGVVVELHGRMVRLADRLDEGGKAWLSIATMFVSKYIRRDLWATRLTSIEAVERFRRIGDERPLAMAQVLHGASLIDMGAFEEGIRVLEETLAMCERSESVAPRGDAKRWLGIALEGMNRLEEARDLEEQAEQDLSNTVIYLASARAMRGWILARLGRLEEAVDLAQGAADMLDFAPSHRAQALAYVSRIELLRGRPGLALIAAERAQAIVEEAGSAGSGETLVYLALVEALEALGRTERARTSLARGRELVTERAQKIVDPRYRASFLERIPEHAWLMSHEVA